MDNKYTAVIKKENEWWIGWIEEVPGVNCQERTKEELLSSLKEILIEVDAEGMPGGVLGAESAAGNDIMDMGVVSKLSSPEPAPVKTGV